MSFEDDYRGEHILPRRWWESLPDFAKAVWLKAYREAGETAEDPAMAAWDRVRKEFVWWPKEGWLHKSSLTAYEETSDRTRCIWLTRDWEWAGGMRPVGELSLPGNWYISEEEAAEFTGEVRRVYEDHYKRMLHSSVDNPHEVACRRIRAWFRETEEGWEKRADETQEKRARNLKERVKLDFTMFAEIVPEDSRMEDEHMVRREYPLLPGYLKQRYRTGYKEALKEEHRDPIWRGWQAVTSEYINDGGTWKRRPQEEREKFQRLRRGD